MESKTKSMKILIATGIYPPHVGGPAHYAQELKKSLEKLGNTVEVATYGIERKLPIGIRHIVYFIRAIFSLPGVEYSIALDTLSTGVPAVFAARIMGKKIIVRTGGDFLWESYVERTGEKIPLSQFYTAQRIFSLKEKIIFKLTKYLLKNASSVVFSTKWQKGIFIDAYGVQPKKTALIENFYGKRVIESMPTKKVFLWAGREITLKNVDMLKGAFEKAHKKEVNIELKLITDLSHEKLMDEIKKCYAIIVPSVSDISPNLILEGIGLGKPFILTKYTGFQEKLVECGIFVDPLNADEIAEKIIYLSDQNNYNEYVKHISNFAYTHSYDEIAREFLALYKTL